MSFKRTDRLFHHYHQPSMFSAQWPVTVCMFPFLVITTAMGEKLSGDIKTQDMGGQEVSSGICSFSN